MGHWTKPDFNMAACVKHNEHLKELYVRLESEGKFISGEDITPGEKDIVKEVKEVIEEKKEEEKVVEKEGEK